MPRDPEDIAYLRLAGLLRADIVAGRIPPGGRLPSETQLMMRHRVSRSVAKWAIFAPVFIPLFMRLGGDPNMVLAAYRVGDSPGNVITPLNVYLGVMVGFAAKYQKDAGIGTIVSLMLPYTAVLLVLWTLLLIAWALLGLPLGPA